MKSKFLLAAVSLLVLSSASDAALITIDPISDGSLYTCVGCNTVSDAAYVLASDYIQGAVKFSTATVPGSVSNAVLTLNPYALPL